jgi:hypothetical protein
MRDVHPKSQNGTHLYRGEKWGKYVAKTPVRSAEFALIDGMVPTGMGIARSRAALHVGAFE